MASEEQRFAVRRAQMVAEQIEGRGIRDEAVLAAMKRVPRHCFVDIPHQDYAYNDTPLPIPAQQTISQPYVVALMISSLELKSSDRVLEVGTGSGYAAALLSCIAKEVCTIERHKRLAELARPRLEQLGYDNVMVFHGDGTMGCPEHAPFDGIIVAAGGPAIPSPLLQQLSVGGRLIMPIGRKRRRQHLVRIIRYDKDEYGRKELGPVAFVPLIGAKGWKR